jgi:outer membrane protein assembly factor BamB
LHASPTIVSDNTIYIGPSDGNLYALNLDGSQRWRFNIGEKGHSCPIVGPDGTVYVGSKQGKIFAVSNSS